MAVVPFTEQNWCIRDGTDENEQRTCMTIRTEEQVPKLQGVHSFWYRGKWRGEILNSSRPYCGSRGCDEQGTKGFTDPCKENQVSKFQTRENLQKT